jgi:hypothetical protein
MELVCPNIVPENNLRLPDALTIRHGPARLLSSFVLEGDQAARQIGIRYCILINRRLATGPGIR